MVGKYFVDAVSKNDCKVNNVEWMKFIIKRFWNSIEKLKEIKNFKFKRGEDLSRARGPKMEIEIWCEHAYNFITLWKVLAMG